MSARKDTIKIGKYIINIRLIALVAAVLVVIIAILAGISSHNKKKREAAAIAAAGYTFDSAAFENVTDIECINERFAVFTDTNGKKGIMKLDGTITEEAGQDKIYAVSDAWRSCKYVCEGPLSEYKLLIDPETCTITAKQYHGATEPEKLPVWDETEKCLIWNTSEVIATSENAEGEKPQRKVDKVRASELSLDNGLYPVASGSKYGYINENMQLDIALLYTNAKDFSDGLAAVEKGGLWGYIDENGKEVIPCMFNSVGEYGAFSFVNGVAPACKEGRCGLINKSGEMIISFDFDEILQGADGKYIARKNGLWGIMTVNQEVYEAQTTTVPETTAGPSVSGGKYKVVTSGSPLNMRASADASASIVAKIPNGTIITVSESKNGWAYTVYSSAQGWVSTQYIAEVAEPETAETLDITEIAQ